MQEEGRRQSLPSRRLVMRKTSLQHGKGLSLMDVNAAGGANLIVPDFDFNHGTSFRTTTDNEETREDELYRRKILAFTRRVFFNIPLIIAILCYCGITALIVHVDWVRESTTVEVSLIFLTYDMYHTMMMHSLLYWELTAGFLQQYFSASHSGLAFFSAFVGFILVFRTQICYNRWWEGRCLWGDLIFSAINLAQQGQSSFHDKENLRRLCCLIVNFAFACKSQLYGMSIEDDGDYLIKRGLISKEELQTVASRLGWQPYYFLGGMREIIDKDLQFSGMMAKMGEEYSFKGSTTDAQLIIMDGALGILASNIGSLIRVKATGLPLGYDSSKYGASLLFLCSSMYKN